MLNEGMLDDKAPSEIGATAETQCGCDKAHNGRSLNSIDDALALIAANASIVPETETVPLDGSLGRVLAEPVKTHANLPPFDNSAMDGYAVDASALSGSGPWALKLADRIPAGQSGAGKVPKGEAARIFTGAPLPAGTDTVVMQEDVVRLPNGIVLNSRPETGMNIRRAGEELAVGSPVLSEGCTIGTREIAACAAAGQGSVKVRRKVRVAILVTGDEICAAGQPLGDAGIWDVNTPMLRSALSHASVELVEIVQCADNRAAMVQSLQDVSSKVDLLITSGAVSVGEEDHVKPALKSLGADIHFSGVAIKPGKPVSFGQIGTALWVGLPGNPLSAYVTWQVFGSEVLRCLSGRIDGAAQRRLVEIGSEINHRIGRTELRLASLIRGTGFDRDIAQFAKATHSARVTGLPDADGLVVIPAETDHLPQGSLVDFLPFHDV